MKSDNDTMSNHPIKFSPLDFDPDKSNHNILKEGTYFYVTGKKGKVPLFGKARESSVAECGTCHDPHGKSRLPKLHRIKNTGGEICLTCHIGIKS
jgi:predicted CXXCH cytochrome family protein